MVESISKFAEGESKSSAEGESKSNGETKKFIFVQGPTGAGKSTWALEQVKKIPNSCIVNCDSVQIYKHVDIGSNKPSPAEFQLAPHYLYSQVAFPETISAGQFERLFFSTVAKLKEKIIFVVGGTGFYFQAIEKGMYPVSTVPENIKVETQELVASHGFSYLFDWIRKKDPHYSLKISCNDHYRIERAYQLMKSENKTVTQIQNEFHLSQRSFPYPLLKIGITNEKERLRQLITERTKKLLLKGLVEEVQELLAQGMGDWEPLNSVGYKEVVSFLSNKGSQQTLADEITQNTMKLVKKQKTWFQKDKQIIWLRSEDQQVTIVDSFIFA